MTTSLERDIRSRLQSYLLGETNLEAFAAWLWSTTFSIASTDNSGLVSLAGEVQLRLSEFDSGHWTEPELREQLHRLLNAPVEHVAG
jgi:hypothetical protein